MLRPPSLNMTFLDFSFASRSEHLASAMPALDSASEAAFHEFCSSFLISSTCFMQLSNAFFLSSVTTRTWSRCS
uniref:NUA n=1 Tax=Arundo donax TaxID=35708 RepID=A0A0A9F424_ARUDO